MGVFVKSSSFKNPVCGAATLFVAKSCIKTELFKSAPFCCMFLATFLEKSLKVAQNGESHSQIGPQKSCRLTKHFFEIPRSLSNRPLSKNPLVGRQLFFVAKSCVKTELFKPAPLCCMFLTTFLEKRLKVAQNGENHSQIGPQNSCRPTKHFFETPRSLSNRPLSKKPVCGAVTFFVAKTCFKTE